MVGMILFACAGAIELALMVHSLITHSRQQKTRSRVRLVSFAIFLIIVLSPVISWSWRLAGFGLLLLAQALISLRIMLLKKDQDDPIRIGKTITRTIFSMLLIFISLIPFLLFPSYTPLPPSGAYAVATTRYTYTDESRKEVSGSHQEQRHVHASFWYPEADSGNPTFPLIVFSHGGLGTETSNESLFYELASHGYVVVSVGHPGHSLWTKSEDGHITWIDRHYFREIQQENARRDKAQSYQYYQKWINTRTADIHCVIETILASAKVGTAGIYALVDQEKIGVMGHSLGGSAALAIPRQRDDIDAVIALEAPFLYDIIGVEKNTFVLNDQAYPVPVMNIYSDSAWNHLSEWPQYAQNAALLTSPTADTLNLHLPGAGHFSLTDLALASPPLVWFLEGWQADHNSTDYLRQVNQACLDFFNHYLKGSR